MNETDQLPVVRQDGWPEGNDRGHHRKVVAAMAAVLLAGGAMWSALRGGSGGESAGQAGQTTTTVEVAQNNTTTDGTLPAILTGGRHEILPTVTTQPSTTTTTRLDISIHGVTDADPLLQNVSVVGERPVTIDSIRGKVKDGIFVDIGPFGDEVHVELQKGVYKEQVFLGRPSVDVPDNAHVKVLFGQPAPQGDLVIQTNPHIHFDRDLGSIPEEVALSKFIGSADGQRVFDRLKAYMANKTATDAELMHKVSCTGLAAVEQDLRKQYEGLGLTVILGDPPLPAGVDRAAMEAATPQQEVHLYVDGTAFGTGEKLTLEQCQDEVVNGVAVDNNHVTVTAPGTQESGKNL